MPGGYGPDHVNVRDQRRDPESLWRFMQRLVQTYREFPELGWGTFTELPQPERAVLVHACTWRGSSIVAAHNLSPDPVTVAVTVPSALEPDGVLEDVHSGRADLLDSKSTAYVDLEAYGHRWWRLRGQD